jgi:hypothetical protein
MDDSPVSLILQTSLDPSNLSNRQIQQPSRLALRTLPRQDYRHDLQPVSLPLAHLQYLFHLSALLFGKADILADILIELKADISIMVLHAKLFN